MKKILTFLLFTFLFFSLRINAQESNYGIVFSKFKLEWFNIMGIRGRDGQRLKLSFKNTSDQVLKYVKVHYWAINSVNDITTDQYGRKEFSVNCTGPFKKNKWNKLEVEIALFHPNLLKAYPHKIEITYMDDEEKEIEISKGNIGIIFPNLDYIDIGNAENMNPKSLDVFGDDVYL